MVLIWHCFLNIDILAFEYKNADNHHLLFQNATKFNMSWCLFLLLVIFLLQFCGGQEDQDIIQGRWQDNIRPKLFAQLSSRDYQSFSGILLNDPSAEQNASSRGNRKYSK